MTIGGVLSTMSETNQIWWLGMTDQAKEGDWRWQNNQPVDQNVM
jgi:hypothetical protein